ncbi:MAG: hydroxymyristoyl-ACP dehydratase [Burkholderiaceae bacterium]|nr:hydroxymyristoyl-ACP dehydratase [Burkholderiaceae bacterium]
MPATLDRAGIAARVPHQGAMCLLEAMDACDADTILCRITNHAAPSNPLRLDEQLPAASALEYASQAMALHGRLATAGAKPPSSGFLASARDVRMHVGRLDTATGPLRVQARRLAGDAGQAMYRFELRDAHGRLLVEGRTTVVLDTPLASPAPGAS